MEYNGGQIPVLITLASNIKAEYFLLYINLPIEDAVNELFNRLFNV